MDELADKLRTEIEKSGLSASEIGRKADVPQQMVSRFINGKGITTKTACAISRALGFEVRIVRQRKK